MNGPQLTAASWVSSAFLTASDNDPSETGEKIRSFSRLKKEWHFGEGSPPKENLLKKAIELDGLAQTLGFTHTDAFPGPKGEVRYCVYDGPNYYEFTLESDGSVTTLIENDGTESEIVSSFEEARDVLKRFSIWNISDSFIGNIGTNEERTFKVWLFRTRQKTQASQWLTKIAQNDMAATSVVVLIDSTQHTRPVLRYGFSTQNYSPKELRSQASAATLETSAIATYAA
jgi:hypothetical protein